MKVIKTTGKLDLDQAAKFFLRMEEKKRLDLGKYHTTSSEKQ